MYSKKNSSRKVLAVLLCVVLLIGGAIGGTLAYLMTNTQPVTNTFVAGNIGNLTLAETKGDSFIVTPGVNITKDPTVTFNGNNVDAYVFVKVEETGWTVSDNGLTYSCVDSKVKWEIDAGWIYLGNGVYYREVAADTTPALTDAEKYPIIKANTITVDSTITQENLDDAVKDSTFGSQLKFTAYAIQKAETESKNFTPEDAWELAKNLPPKS